METFSPPNLVIVMSTSICEEIVICSEVSASVLVQFFLHRFSTPQSQEPG